MTRRKIKKTYTPDEYNEDYFLTNWGGFEERLQGKISLRHQRALEYLKVHPGEVILDVGCARGEFLQLCGEKGGIIIGLDYSPTAIKISSIWKNENIKVIQASATALPFRAGIFDKVTMLDLIEHVTSDDLLKCLKEVRRVVKDDGQVLIHTPNQWGDYAFSVYCKLMSLLRLVFRNVEPNLKRYSYSLHVHVLNPISLQRTLRTAGFKGKMWFSKHPQTDAPYHRLVMDRILFFLTTMWFRAYKA